jgi:D-alanyl-lipoteichoic acid acyltransferase DltB (MBOAT superfamily)
MIAVLIMICIFLWIKPNLSTTFQNGLILISSYVCYGLWDWRFLIIIILITLINFITGIAISKTSTKTRKTVYLIANIGIHLCLLGFFRYHNFFISSLDKYIQPSGSVLPYEVINIIVPLGISVFTLQALSYPITIYQKKSVPTNDTLAFFTYVSFFPQMFVGPIERATTLLPQLTTQRQFSAHDIKRGFKQILWGVFKIVVIANNLAIYSAEIFSNYIDYTGITILAGLGSFAIQFYACLSGFSDIATGIARLLGLDLSINFRFPFFSRNLTEFWSKWNISLMDWLKDYVFYPLGGADGKKITIFRNLFILFFLVLLWHGGNTPTILFALLNALIILSGTFDFFKYQILYKRKSVVLRSIISISQYIITMFIILLGFTFFRAESSADAILILKQMFSNVFSVSINELRSLGNGFFSTISNVIILLVYVLIEWIHREKKFALDNDNYAFSSNKEIILTVIIIMMILFFNQEAPDYLYLVY